MSRPHPLMVPVPGAFAPGGFPLVELDRGSLDTHLRRGFVLGASATLTLLHAIDEGTYRLNGYSLLRNADLRSWQPVPREDFLARAARLQRLRPRAPGPLRLTSWAAALTDAAALFPLVTIHRESAEPGVCHVGRLAAATARTVTLQALSPDAEWEGAERFPTAALTLAEFGGAYETLLHRLAAGRSAPPA